MEIRFTVILLLLSVWLQGQTDTSAPVIITMDSGNNEVYAVVDTEPRFGENEGDLFLYFQKESKFPVIKREKNVLGQSVYVNIIIGKSGSVIEHKIIKGVSPQLDKETLRLIKSMPPWKPGMIKGKPVKVSKTIEVRYKMN